MRFLNGLKDEGKSQAIEILPRSRGYMAPFQFGVAVSVTEQTEEVALRLYEIGENYDMAIVVLKQQVSGNETFVAYIMPPEIPGETAIGKDRLRQRLSTNGFYVTEQRFTALSSKTLSILKLRLGTRNDVNVLLAILEAQALAASRQIAARADWACLQWY